MGMKEKNDGTLKPIGLEKLIDKADIAKGIQSYIPKKLKDDVEILTTCWQLNKLIYE